MSKHLDQVINEDVMSHYEQRMSPEECEIYLEIREKINETLEELSTIPYHEQLHVIKRYQSTYQRWLKAADGFCFINLKRALQELPSTFNAFDYENEAYIQRYIEEHPNMTGIDIVEAEAFFEPLCRKKHHSSFDTSCLGGHLVQLREISQVNLKTLQAQKEAELNAKRAKYLHKSFFGD